MITRKTLLLTTATAITSVFAGQAMAAPAPVYKGDTYTGVCNEQGRKFTNDLGYTMCELSCWCTLTTYKNGSFSTAKVDGSDQKPLFRLEGTQTCTLSGYTSGFYNADGTPVSLLQSIANECEMTAQAGTSNGLTDPTASANPLGLPALAVNPPVPVNPPPVIPMAPAAVVAAPPPIIPMR